MRIKQRRARRPLQAIYRDIQASQGVDEETAAALSCALPILFWYSPKFEQSWSWLEQAEDDWFRATLDRLGQWRDRSRGPLGDSDSTILQSIEDIQHAFGPDNSVLLWHLYELLLDVIDPGHRRERGTFYTPPPVARYLVHQADCQLRDHLGLRRGLFDGKLRGKILEPACGSGVFLAAAIKCCRSHPDWNQQTAGDVVQRLAGIDLSRAALFLCRLRLAVLLRTSGIELSPDFPQPTLWCGNALSGPEYVPPLRDPVAVVLGNPPFSARSLNEQPWIQSLIRGDSEHAGYFAIDGESLAERKTWLHDDYVKFLRLAQWCIDQNGHGVVSLVTNHGWLDNATFRIARQQLLRTFDQIHVVDLHGNAKRHEASPTGERDENVFGIAQGIALVSLTRSADPQATPAVSRADLWGKGTEKLAALSHAADAVPLPTERLQPAAPWFAFTAAAAPLPRDYRAAPRLPDVMPVHSTVPVTARDHFVIARTREELLDRLQTFCDAQFSDDVIREHYFAHTRSARYPSGDSRGWKLSAAREVIRAEADLKPFLRRCLYRPFVWRYVFWHPAMIDWPRHDVSQHLLLGDNLALLARRQSVAGREANFFWITDCLPLDGVIRSDNRGSESFFPLWIVDGKTRTANFAGDWLQAHEPRAAVAYLYALFHSPAYRTLYAAGLAMEFPRVLQPAEEALFQSLAELGAQLIKLHLTDPQDASFIPYAESRLPQSTIDAFHVGTYNVCRKWLQMESESRDSLAFARLQQLIAQTLGLQIEIDERIQEAGGFPGAFRTIQA